MAGWKMKRGDQEYIAPDAATLAQWIAQGKMQPNDYVFNPTLDRWMLASEVPELAPSVRSKTSSAARGSCGLAIALFLFAVMLGMMHIGTGLAMLLTAGAFIFAIVAGILYVMKK